MFKKIILSSLVFFLFPTIAWADWQFSGSEDEFDGSVFLAWSSLPAEDYFSERPTLYVRFRDNDGFNVILKNGDPFICPEMDIGTYSVNEYVTVQYRFDDLEAVKEKWSPSTNSASIFAPNPINFARSLQNYSRLVIRTKDGCGSQKTLRFELDGSTGPIGKVLTGAGEN